MEPGEAGGNACAVGWGQDPPPQPMPPASLPLASSRAAGGLTRGHRSPSGELAGLTCGQPGRSCGLSVGCRPPPCHPGGAWTSSCWEIKWERHRFPHCQLPLFKTYKMALLKERQKHLPCTPTPASQVSPRGCSEPSFLCLLSEVPLPTVVTFAEGSGRSPCVFLGFLSGFSLGTCNQPGDSSTTELETVALTPVLGVCGVRLAWSLFGVLVGFPLWDFY